MLKRLLFLPLFFFICYDVRSEDSTPRDRGRLGDVLSTYFVEYSAEGYRPIRTMALDSFRVDEKKREIVLFPNEAFCSQGFTTERVKKIREEISRLVTPFYKKADIRIFDRKGREISELIPNILRESGVDKSRLWRGTDYEGEPWVSFPDRPYHATKGLEGRHLYIYPSHGRVYRDYEWQWQRPLLFCTTEDLFTQSIVYPFLFPMLERAGAIVYSPRERDTQIQEVIIDNDFVGEQGKYLEHAARKFSWQSSGDLAGFAPPKGLMNDLTFPFQSGTYRKIKTTKHRNETSRVTWQANIPEDGNYAVYVSYGKEENAVPDAHYTVGHSGGVTRVRVNQQIGGGTWVYLGTYFFKKGNGEKAYVVLTNESKEKGVVTADGVRFGGGFAQTERGLYGTSGVPRFLEAARYQAAWAGIPDSLVNTMSSSNDYTDDLRVRGNMVNYLAGGSAFLPDRKGAGVPFELALAVHSDAGVRRDGSVYGSLAIFTSRGANGDSILPGGPSRAASYDLAALVLNNLSKDLSKRFKVAWTRREHWDRNYAETRMPLVPSAIIETLSHQNFGDFLYGHDPLFKFALSRSLYASICRYVNFQHGRKECTIQPLPVTALCAELIPDGGGAAVRLSWQARTDSIYRTRPGSYIVYTRNDGGGYDNGQVVKNTTVVIPLTTGRTYDFRVTAVNEGGESFPSETLSVRFAGPGKKHALLVNAFTRLSGPARVFTPDAVGFDLQTDIGVPYISTTAFSGRQLNFDASLQGKEGLDACGYSGTEYVGKTIAGNSFDYPSVHGVALSEAGDYSFSSTSVRAFQSSDFSTRGYDLIDYIAGVQGRFPHNLHSFPVFPSGVLNKLSSYLINENGRLLLSGSNVVSDGTKEEEGKRFFEELLGVRLAGTATTDSLGRLFVVDERASLAHSGSALFNSETEQAGCFELYGRPSSACYTVSRFDLLTPLTTGLATPCRYFTPDGTAHSAAVATLPDNYRSLLFSFPLEAVKGKEKRTELLRRALKLLFDE